MLTYLYYVHVHFATITLHIPQVEVSSIGWHGYYVLVILQNVDELERLLEQALSEVSALMVTLLQKEVSSDNLESIFKVRFAMSVCLLS